MAIPLQGWSVLNVTLSVWNVFNIPTTAQYVKAQGFTVHFCGQTIFPAKTPAQKGCTVTITAQTRVNTAFHNV